MANLVVLAFSGGLDTSWCVPWLKENRAAEVVTVTVDVGGISAEKRDELERRSHELGAREHVHVDARSRFFDQVLRFLIFGNVLRGGVYPLCVGAERTLQAGEVARVAGELGAQAVAHGCTAAGNDQVRFEVALRVLAAELEILAPVRDLAPSRQQETDDLKAWGFFVPAATTRWSINAGLWGVTIGGQETHHTGQCLPEEAWVRTRGAFGPEGRTAEERHVLGFQAGLPCALDGEALDPVALLERLDQLAGAFGIGRGIHLGDTILGIKGRVAFEAPAASTLISAHRELEKLTLTGMQQRVKDQVAAVYGDLVHTGQLLDPVCRDVEALLASSQARVSGEVRLLLRPGCLFVEGVTAAASLHAASASVYGEAACEWTPAEAAGFSRMCALPALLHRRAGAQELAP